MTVDRSPRRLAIIVWVSIWGLEMLRDWYVVVSTVHLVLV